MTAVATRRPPAVTSRNVSADFTPHRNVRVSPQTWDPFGENVGSRNRSAWINEFIEMVNRDPDTWHAAKRIARIRGELLEAVVVAALRRYVARNQHLLDNQVDE